MEHIKIIDEYRNDSEQGKDDAVAYPGILFVGVQLIQLRTEDRENWDLGVVAP